MPDIDQILQDARTIAVVGCSPRKTRTSHKIASYLQDAGFDVIPVNPYHDEILGVTCYPDVLHIPEDVTIDIVNIFRRPEHTAEMVRDVLERLQNVNSQDSSSPAPVIWTQLGVSSDEAMSLAEDADLPYVKNRCLMVEHARR